MMSALAGVPRGGENVIRNSRLTVAGATVLQAFLCCLLSSRVSADPSWARVAILDEDYNEFCAVLPTPDGGCVAAGGHDTARYTRGMVVKFDRDGELQWISSIGGGTGRFLSMVGTADGGYVLGGQDSSVVRLSGGGEVLWHRKYPTSAAREPVHSVLETPDAGFLALTVDRFSAEPAVYLLNLDSTGRIRWQWKYDGVRTGSRCPILLHPSGGYVFAGRAKNDDGALMLLRLNATGKILWQRRYDPPGGFCDPQDLRLTRDGGFMLAANVARADYYTAAAWIAKLDQNGAIQWERTYGEWEAAAAGRGASASVTSLIEAEAGGYLIAGDSNGRAWSARLDQDGACLWQKTYGGPVGGRIQAAAAAGADGWIQCGQRYSHGETRRYALLLRLAADGAIGTACRPRIVETDVPVGNPTTATEAANVLRTASSVMAADGKPDLTRPVPIIGGACATADLTGRWSALDVSGSTVFAMCSITNIGALKARACRLWTYLSDDPVLSAGDPLISVKRVGWVGSGDTFRVAFTYARDTDPAGMYLIGLIDALGAVPEADETNNTTVTLLVR